MAIGLNKTLDGAWEVARESLRSDLIAIETILNQIKLAKGAVTPAAGGTGLSSFVVGDLLYANTVSSLARLADVATGNALISGGVGVAPTWGKIGLTTHVSGVLPVVNGGWGVATLTTHALYVGAGTSAPTALAVGATNTVLHGNTGADPSFSAVVEGDITLANTTTNNVTTGRHGFVPILPNDATKFFDGAGNYSVVTSGLSVAAVAARVSLGA